LNRLAKLVICTVLISTVSSLRADDATTTRFEKTILEISNKHPAVRSRALALAAKLNGADYASRIYPDPMFEVMRMHSRGDEWMLDPSSVSGRRMFRDGMEYRVTQPIPFPGRLTLSARIADLEAESSRLKLGMEKNSLIEEFVSVLIEIRSMKDVLRVTRDIVDRMRITADVAKARYESGGGNLADVSRAGLRLDGYRQKTLEMEAQIEEKEKELDYFVFQSDEQRDNPLQNPVELINLIEKSEELFSYIDSLRQKGVDPGVNLENVSLEIAMAKVEESVKEKEKTLAKMDYLPDFELFAGVGREDFRTSDFSRSYRENFGRAGVSIRIPLWSGLSNHLQVSQRDNDLRSAKAQLDSVVRRQNAEYSAIKKRVISDQSRIHLYEAALVPNAERARDSSFLAYQAGRVDFSTVLDSWANLYMQKSELINLKADAGRRILSMGRLLNILIPEVNNGTDQGN